MVLSRLPRRTVAATLSVAATLVVAACSGPEPEPLLTGDLTEDTSIIARALTCNATHVLHDDVYHFASMRGIICVHLDESITQIRVYESADAAVAALQDWEIGDADRRLLHDGTWFAIGPERSVRSVQRWMRSAAAPTDSIPRASSSQPNPLDDCVQFVSSSAYTFLDDRESFDEDRDAFDSALPGVPTLVESLLQTAASEDLRSLESSDLRFESEFSRLGPDIKSFCSTRPLTAIE